MIALLQNLTNIAPGVSTPFIATGGVPPYTYSVQPGGAGGSIGSSSGLYTAPLSPVQPGIDTVQVVDSAAATATATIAVGTVAQLVADIVRRRLGLATDQVYLWNQKVQPLTDSRLYVAIFVGPAKPFGFTRTLDGSGLGLAQSRSLSCQATIGIDVLSRGPDARDRKEQVLLALSSQYAEQQMEANSFYISALSTTFVDLSAVEGAAIPYRFHIDVGVQYAIREDSALQYFDTFEAPEVSTDA